MNPRPHRVLRAVLVVVCLWAGRAGAEPPRFDNETATTHRRITWDDFRGKLSGSSAEQAQISTAVQALPLNVRATLTNKGYWVASPEEVAFYATMDKTLSGAGKGARTDLLLAHEQGHFDLAEIVARRLNNRLAGVESQGLSDEEARANVMARIRKAHAQALESLAELQATYDRETKHGVARRRQREWSEKIAGWLEAESPARR